MAGPASKSACLQSCLDALSSLSSLIEDYSPLINVCMVDFIVEDSFSTRLDPKIGQELLSLSQDEVARLPQRMISKDWKSGDKALDRLMKRLDDNSLENLGVAQVWNEGDWIEDDRTRLLDHLDRIMGEKKTHEVVAMAKTIHVKAMENQV